MVDFRVVRELAIVHEEIFNESFVPGVILKEAVDKKLHDFDCFTEDIMSLINSKQFCNFKLLNDITMVPIVTFDVRKTVFLYLFYNNNNTLTSI